MGKAQLRTCVIDGLNLGNYEFNWKNRLRIFHSEGMSENIVNAHILIPRPYNPKQIDGGRLTDEENMDQGEAFEIITIFLSCYFLVNVL